ncbi:hypothetical protein TMEG_02023 [Mycobacterium tuberculosis SUMu005]|nr:hypothetical protein TMEG_02023 [Mycobacterium tuberculosis SUMu005]
MGGGVAKSGRLLFEPLRAALADHARLDFLAGLRVVPAELGGAAGPGGCGQARGHRIMPIVNLATRHAGAASRDSHSAIRVAVLADRTGPGYCGCRSTEDRRSPSNRLKVREHPGDPRRRTRQHRRRAPA